MSRSGRQRLRILQEIPHAGANIPASAVPHLQLDPDSIRSNSDLGVARFYPMPADATRVCFPYARAIIDANRPPVEFPYLATADGAIKTHDHSQRQIWADPAGPPFELRSKLIWLHEEYYRRLEQRVREICGSARAMVIWCAHSYTPIPVHTSTTSDALPEEVGHRPDIHPVYMVGNGGDLAGENPVRFGLEEQGASDLAAIYRRHAHRLPPDEIEPVNNDYLTGINYPYQGKQSIERYVHWLEQAGIAATVLLTEIRQDLRRSPWANTITREAHRQVEQCLRTNCYPQL